jgi:hypothetical protein
MDWRSPWLTAIYTGDGANRGEPGATGVQTCEEKFSRMTCRNASPGVEDGAGEACRTLANIPGTRLEKNPCCSRAAVPEASSLERGAA